MHVLNIDDAGHADFVGAHVSECFLTRHMCADKSLDASSDLRFSVKTLLYVPNR